MDFVSHPVFPWWLTKVQVGQGEQRCTLAGVQTTRLPQTVRNYTTEVIYFTKWLAYTDPVGECTLIGLGAPNNGPCVPLSVVGGAEVTSRPPLINVDEMFQKDTKALKGGRAWGEARSRQTDGGRVY